MLIDVKELENWPPFLVRALARDEHGKGLTLTQIAAASGLSLRNVARIASRLTWAGSMDHLKPFCRGCNFDLNSTAKAVAFLRKQATAKVKFKHLSPITRRTFERQMAAWLKLTQAKT